MLALLSQDIVEIKIWLVRFFVKHTLELRMQIVAKDNFLVFYKTQMDVTEQKHISIWTVGKENLLTQCKSVLFDNIMV